jgi:hypothetical protein
MDIGSHLQLDAALKNCYEAFCRAGKRDDFPEITLENATLSLPYRYNDQGYRVRYDGKKLTIGASTTEGFFYALQDIMERVRDDEIIPASWEEAPYMQYRGYTLGLQKQTGHFRDHKYYDWPICPENFPWFYDRNHMTEVLDLLASQRCNMLALWSGHPFASLFKLPSYPEMLEVSEEQAVANEKHLLWLCEEGKKRSIRIYLHFYNIHMSDPLAKVRGWKVLEGSAHEEICQYTRSLLRTFVQKFPEIGLIVCVGEVIAKSDQERWLKEVILRGIKEGASDQPPPLILRSHHFEIEKHFTEASRLYPGLISMNKHNGENLISNYPEKENYQIAKLSKNHIISLHLSANLEPFSWGSPRFIRDTLSQMIRQDAAGILVFPLRFWDWPHSSHRSPLGNQLHEHFVWWTAWGRYAWNPNRDEVKEEIYWQNALSREYDIDSGDAKNLLDALQETASVLPEIASQFMISSGNRQNFSLGQFLVPLAFTRLQYQSGSGYSMNQLCGFPLIGEQMWSLSPLDRMDRQIQKCQYALSLLKSSGFPGLIRSEIEVLLFITQFYLFKAKACTAYFQVLYGTRRASVIEAEAALEKSVAIYKTIVEKTIPLFRDAGGLQYRSIPLPAKQGYLHWKDCLDKFKEELAIAKSGGIKALLSWKP